MTETSFAPNNFVGYEYKDITVNEQLAPVYADGYTSFGWKLDNTGRVFAGLHGINMKFKRDRKIRNKAELTRLQRQFEAGIEEIESLEKSKLVGASATAYAVGLVGSAFMAGSVFAYLVGMIPLMIILAVPGFLGWALPYFLYNRLNKKRTAKVEPLIDKKYDELYQICEQASALTD